MLTARREETARVHSEGVHEKVPMQECKDASKKLLELIWVDADKSVDLAHKKIQPRLWAREYKTTKQGKIRRALLASQVLSALPPLESVKALVSIMMSVSRLNKGKPLKLRHYDISRAHIRLPAEDRQKYGEDKGGRLIKNMYGTQEASHFWQLDYVTLICGELG